MTSVADLLVLALHDVERDGVPEVRVVLGILRVVGEHGLGLLVRLREVLHDPLQQLREDDADWGRGEKIR